MRKNIALLFGVALVTCSCETLRHSYLETSSPEEKSSDIVRITNISDGKISGHNASATNVGVDYEHLICGYSEKSNVCWGYARNLVVSPDGKMIAFVTNRDGANNISVQESSFMGKEVQRTTRNVMDGIYWGADNQIYFADNNDPNVFISSIDGKNGASVLQVTKGDVIDYDPILTDDGKTLFFTRWSALTGPSVFMSGLENGTPQECCKGFAPCPVPGSASVFYCARNSASGRTEIWQVDNEKKTERVILSDANCSFTHPSISPDGKWLLVVGNSISSISKCQNLDIFVARTDGSGLKQLTSHPANDSSPVWAKDGRSIYFISNRGMADKNSFNVWKMNFNME